MKFEINKNQQTIVDKIIEKYQNKNEGVNQMALSAPLLGRKKVIKVKIPGQKTKNGGIMVLNANTAKINQKDL